MNQGARTLAVSTDLSGFHVGVAQHAVTNSYDLETVHATRLLIERQVVEDAAPHITDEAINRLHNSLRAQADCTDDPVQFLISDREFHVTIYRACGKARLGGGMFSYFKELNRKRPPVALLDVVSFTTSAMVHAGDDRSMTESLQALPAIAASAAAIAAPLPIVVGPSAIGMRANPYGDKPKKNIDNICQAMNWNDPRQRGLLGAAWDLGYVAGFAYGGAQSVALGGLTGPFGALHVSAGYPQPWYDGQGGLFPVFHALRGLAGLRGKALRALNVSRPSDLLGIAAETSAGTEVWLANLTARDLSVRLDLGAYDIARLDADNFVKAAGEDDLFDQMSPGAGPDLTLSPYAAVRLRARVQRLKKVEVQSSCIFLSSVPQAWSVAS